MKKQIPDPSTRALIHNMRRMLKHLEAIYDVPQNDTKDFGWDYSIPLPEDSEPVVMKSTPPTFAPMKKKRGRPSRKEVRERQRRRKWQPTTK